MATHLGLKCHCLSMLLTFASLLAFWVIALNMLYSFFINPACTLPLLKSSEFCLAIYGIPPATHNSPSTAGHDIRKRILCMIAPLSYFTTCEHEPRHITSTPPTDTSILLGDQFSAYSSLVDGTSTTPAFGREIRDLVMSLEDMVILLKGSSVRNKAALISHVTTVRHTSRESARCLQKYTAKLLSCINLILTSSEFTIDVAHSLAIEPVDTFSQIEAFWGAWTRMNEKKIHTAYLHMIKTFETLNRQLTHLNGETYESIVALDSHVEALMDLIYDEALIDAKQEVGEILGRFWTMLGGYRTLLLDARERMDVLTRVGASTRMMRAFVLDIQLRLEGLQAGTEELRAQAAEPLLIDGPIPMEDVIRALTQGCILLKGQLAGATLTLGSRE